MNTFLILLVSILPQVDELQSKANSALDKAENKYNIISTPNPDDTVEKCPCNGRGYIVHGDGHRTSCPGTDSGPCQYKKDGMFGLPIDSIDLQEKYIIIDGQMYRLVKDTSFKQEVRENGVIELYTADWCQPCQELKTNQRWQGFWKSLIQVGWKVRIVDLTNGGNAPNEHPIPCINVILRGESNVYPADKLNKGLLDQLNEKYSKRDAS